VAILTDDNGNLIYVDSVNGTSIIHHPVTDYLAKIPVRSAQDERDEIDRLFAIEPDANEDEYDDRPIAEPHEFDDGVGGDQNAGEWSAPVRYEIQDLDKLVLMLTLWIPDVEIRTKLEEIYTLWKELQKK